MLCFPEDTGAATVALALMRFAPGDPDPGHGRGPEGRRARCEGRARPHTPYDVWCWQAHLQVTPGRTVDFARALLAGTLAGHSLAPTAQLSRSNRGLDRPTSTRPRALAATAQAAAEAVSAVQALPGARDPENGECGGSCRARAKPSSSLASWRALRGVP